MGVLSLYVLLLLAQPAVTPSPSPSPSPDVTWARVRQDEIPDLNSRRLKAETKATAAEKYFAGKASFATSFPDLANGELGSMAWWDGQLALLDAKGRARERERQQPLPDVGTSARKAQWRQLLEQTIEAEERADAAYRRLIHAHQSLLERRPELSDDSLQLLLQPIDARVQQATERWKRADETNRRALGEAVARAVSDKQALLNLVERIRQVATTDRSAPLDVSDDLAALEGPGAQAAVDRLLLARPFLDPDARARVDERVLDWLQVATQRTREELRRQQALAPITDANVAEATRARASAELARLDARLGNPRRTDDLLANAQRALWGAQRELAEAQIARASAEPVPAPVDVGEEASEARRRAEEARSEAERAMAAADDNSSRRTAESLMAAANAQIEEARLWDEVKALESDLEAKRKDYQEQIAELDGATDPADAYRSSRALLNALQDEAVRAAAARRAARRSQSEHEDELETTRDEINALRDASATLEPPIQEYLDALSRWERALSQQERALDARVDLHTQHRTALVNMQRELRAKRIALEPQLSRDLVLEDRTRLPRDIWSELQFAAPHFWTEELNRIEGLTNLPKQLFTASGAWEVGKDLLGILFGVLVWWWCRSRAPMFVRYIVDRWVNRRGRLFAREIRRVQEPATDFARSVINLTAVVAAMLVLRARLPEVSLVLLVAAQFIGYQAVNTLFRLLVTRRDRPRPALANMGTEGYQMAETSVRLAALWVIGRQFSRYVLLDLLHAEVLDSVAVAVFWFLLVVFAFWLLHAWEPWLQDAVRRGGGQNRIVQLLIGRPHRNPFLRWLYALTDLVVLVVRQVGALVQGRFDEDSLIGRLFTFIERYRMKETSGEQKKLPPLPRAFHDRLVAAECPEDCYVERPDADETFLKALHDYIDAGRRGVIAVVGDRGDGKRTWLDHVLKQVSFTSHRIVRARIGRRLSSEPEVVEWLSENLGFEKTDDANRLATLLKETEPALFIIEETQLAFLRAVGGFDGLRTLLHIVSQHDERHCWVLSMHRPAWWYLSRVEDALGADIFRAVIELQPMTDDQLRELVTLRTEHAGYQATFHPLVRRNPLASSQYSSDLRQATHAYFRLLADSAQGNPAVALRLWASSLYVQDGDEGTCDVHLTPEIRALTFPELDETELFNLAALRIQDRLNVDELIRVNNMQTGQVLVSLEVLVGHGLIDKEGDEVNINLLHLPGVTRTLRRRQLLHWRQ